MAIDKAVDSSALDAALTYTADRIRAKTGSADQISWDAAKGFGAAVDGIQAGDDTYLADSGSYAMYKKTMDLQANGIPFLYGCAELEEVHAPNFNGAIAANTFRNCPKLKIVDIPNAKNVGSSFAFWGDTALETLAFPKLNNASNGGWNNAGTFRDCTGLKTVQLGSVGYSAYPTSSYIYDAFLSDTQSELMITIYVPDKATLPISGQPWGATNATIVYRSTTTGEVIEI